MALDTNFPHSLGTIAAVEDAHPLSPPSPSPSLFLVCSPSLARPPACALGSHIKQPNVLYVAANRLDRPQLPLPAILHTVQPKLIFNTEEKRAKGLKCENVYVEWKGESTHISRAHPSLLPFLPVGC